MQLVQAVTPAPILRLPLQERTNSPQVAFMAQKVRLLRPLGPELDGVRKSVHGLAMTADERTTKVNVFQTMLLGMEIGDLAYVVTVARR